MDRATDGWDSFWMVGDKVDQITWGEAEGGVRAALVSGRTTNGVFDVMDRKILASPARTFSRSFMSLATETLSYGPQLKGGVPLYNAPTLVLHVSERFQ